MRILCVFIIVFVYEICSTFSNGQKVFPVSTEIQLGKMKTLIDRAPNGIFLTVGGDRGFRGGSMFEGIDHLIIFDISPDIIRFDTINRELLKAPNKEVYKNLRWESSYTEWLKVSKTLTEQDFNWWQENVRNMRGYDLPENLNRYGQGNKFIKVRKKLLSVFPKVSKKYNNYHQSFLKNVSWSDIEDNQKNSKDPLTKDEFSWFDQERKTSESCIQKFIQNPSQAVDWGQVIDYKSGNYLFDDKLYDRLHQLVLAQKVTIIQLDLTKADGIDLLVTTIKNLHSKLAIVDLNNLYRYEYIGEEKFRIALAQLLSLGDDKSILILMSNYIDYPCAQFSIYIGFTFENIRSWPETPFFTAFIETLPHDILPLIDRRLYEGKDELPLYLMPTNVSINTPDETN